MRGERTRVDPSRSAPALQRLAVLSIAAAAGLSGRAAKAADTWVGNTSANWGDANWTGTNNPPASGDALVFGTAGTAGGNLNDNLTTTAFNVAGITYNAGASAFNVSGNAFALTGAVVNNGTNIQTLNDAITLGAAETVNAAAGQVSLGGPITGAFVLTATGPNAITLGGANSVSGLTLGTSVAANTNTNSAFAGIVGTTTNLNSSQTINALLVGSGGNVINVAGGDTVTATSVAGIGSNDRFTALNINLGTGASFVTTATNTNGVISIGSQFNLLTLNGTDFAASSASGTSAALTTATYTTLAASGSVSSQNSTVLADLSLSGSQSMNTLRFGDTTGHTITITPGQTLSLNGPGGGGGTVLMSAASGAVVNTITGGSLIGSSNRGTAILDYDTTPGAALVINSALNNYILSGSGSSGTASVLVAGGGAVTLGGANFINGSLLVDRSNLSVASDANLGAVNGTVSVLTAANGSTTVTLAANNTNTSGLAVGDVLLGQVISVISSNGQGATVTLASAYTGTSIASATTVGYVGGGAIGLNGATLSATSSFTLGETNNTGNASTGLNTTTRNRSLSLGLKGGTIDVASGATLSVPGVITSPAGNSATIGALNKVDSGTLAIAGSASNTNLFLNNQAGTTTLGNTAGYAANVVTITGGTVGLATGAPNVAQIGSALNVNGGTLDLNGFGGLISSIAVVNGTGGTITNNSATSNAILYVGNGGGSYSDSLSIASNLTDGPSKNLAANFQGNAANTRTVTLSGSNTYSGATTVGGATLVAGSTTAFSPNSAFTLSTTSTTGGGSLNLNGYSNAVGSLAGGNTSGGSVSLGAATLTTGGNNASTTYAGVISGTGGLIKTGTGTFSLATPSTYTGGTNISNGTVLANATAASLGTNTITISSGGTLGGTGVTGGGVTIASGGTITAGTGSTAAGTAGTLNASGGTLTLGGGTYNAKINFATAATNGVSAGGTGISDELLVSVLAASGATPNLLINPVPTTSGGSPAALTSYSFVIADAVGSAGSPNTTAFDALLSSGAIALTPAALAAGYTLDHTADASTFGEDLLLDYTSAAPEPTSLLLATLAAAPLTLGRRRRRQA